MALWGNRDDKPSSGTIAINGGTGVVTGAGTAFLTQTKIIDALINIEILHYNDDYEKEYLTLDNLIKKLIMFIDYSIKFKETEDNKSIIISLEWMCKLLERATGRDRIKL